MLVTLFDGHVPWMRWECTRRKSGHSVWVAFQTPRLVKGRRALPEVKSSMVMLCTTMSSMCEMKEHTWHFGSSHGGGGGGGGAFLLAKSAGVFAEPDKCCNRTWYRLTVDRYVGTRGLLENSPWHNFSYPWQQGLLSVRTIVWCRDCIMYGLKFFTAAAIPRASTSHGSHVTWCRFSFALNRLATTGLLSRLMYKVALIPYCLTDSSVTIHS